MPLHTRFFTRFVRPVWVAAWACAVCAPVLAQVQAPAPAMTNQDLDALSSQWLEGAVYQAQTQNAAAHQVPLRMEVVVGQLDRRLNLAPCAQVEPYMPSGSKLWGRTRIGLRCVQGAKPWNVFLPVTIKAWGPAWVLTQNISVGDTLVMGSAAAAEVDWAAETSPIIALPEDWVGQAASRPLMAGQALRQHMVRPPQLFEQGATVKVLVNGGGFIVTSSGRAMTSGGQGQEVRVRMDNGRFVSGRVNAQGEVVVAQ